MATFSIEFYLTMSHTVHRMMTEKTIGPFDWLEARLADPVWSMEELASILPMPEVRKRGPYKKKAAEFQAAPLPHNRADLHSPAQSL